MWGAGYAIISSMARVRISTTVNGERLETCRRMLGLPDSRILDRALAALLDRLETEKEVAALQAQPYEGDPDLAWQAPPGPDLPYDGEIPAEVRRLAQRRRTG